MSSSSSSSAEWFCCRNRRLFSQTSETHYPRSSSLNERPTCAANNRTESQSDKWWEVEHVTSQTASTHIIITAASALLNVLFGRLQRVLIRKHSCNQINTQFTRWKHEVHIVHWPIRSSQDGLSEGCGSVHLWWIHKDLQAEKEEKNENDSGFFFSAWWWRV